MRPLNSSRFDLKAPPIPALDSVPAKCRRIAMLLPAHWGAVMGGSQYQAKMLLEHLLDAPEADVFYLARRVPAGPVTEGYELRQIASAEGFRRHGPFLDVFDLLKL